MASQLGAALVLVAAGMLGAVIARSYQERPRLLRALQAALTMLATEISFAATPLPEALLRVARHAPAPVAAFLAEVGRSLDQQPDQPAGEVWARALIAPRGWCLAPEDEAVLLDLGGYLGRSAAADQERHLRLALTQLARLQAEAEAQRDLQVRLWRYLGLCAGGSLVLLLY